MAGRLMVVSAPGKVILHGGHAVVYGKPALATSVGLRCYVVLEQVEDTTGAVTLDLPDFDHSAQWSILTLRGVHTLPNETRMTKLKELAGITSESPATQNTATLVFLYLLTHICRERLSEYQGFHVTVISTLPASAGLGSSAAFSVSLAASFLSLIGEISHNQQRNDPLHQQASEDSNAKSGEIVDRANEVNVGLPKAVLERLDKMGVSGSGYESGWSPQELEVVNEWGLKAEELIHGTPSGIDNSVSTFGGAIRFCSGKITRIERMPKVRILLVNTKVVRSTKKMVAGVRELHDKYPSVVGPILDSVEAIVEKAESLLLQLAARLSDPHTQPPLETNTDTIHAGLQDLCEVNQHLLNSLGVGHGALDQVCAVARERGLAAKLTGAGGGGCAFILLPPDYPWEKLKELMEALSKAGFESWETTIGSAGVTAHNTISTA